MESATTATATESAATEAASAGAPYAGESVIALHSRGASVLDATKGAMISFLRPRRETACAPSAFIPASALITAKSFSAASTLGPAGSFGATEGRRTAESGRATEPVCDRAIRIRHTHPMSRIVRPSAAQSRMEIVKSIAMEEIAV
jgi:hypothetical protein